jgi:hypothetical protein
VTATSDQDSLRGDPARPVAVVDIDGVVADVRPRLVHLESTPKDWDAFFDTCSEDPALPQGIALALALRHEHDVIWLTGRPERTRAATEAWLRRHGLPSTPMFMRAEGDRRPARQTKLEVVRGISEQRRIAMIVDDDPAVVRELQDHGYPVKLADWVPHPALLRQAQQRDGRT